MSVHLVQVGSQSPRFIKSDNRALSCLRFINASRLIHLLSLHYHLRFRFNPNGIIRILEKLFWPFRPILWITETLFCRIFMLTSWLNKLQSSWCRSDNHYYLSPDVIELCRLQYRHSLHDENRDTIVCEKRYL